MILACGKRVPTSCGFGISLINSVLFVPYCVSFLLWPCALSSFVKDVSGMDHDDLVPVLPPPTTYDVPAKPFWPPDLPETYRQRTRTNPTTGEVHAILPVTSTCNGWRTLAHTYCANRAGHRTDHPGTGRCHFHDTGPIMTAARVRLGHIAHTAVGALALELEAAEDDPTDITSELHLARSLLLNWIKRYEHYMEHLALWAQAFANHEVGHAPPMAMDISRIDVLLRRVADLALQVQQARLLDSVSQGELIEILRTVSQVVDVSVTTCPTCHAPLTSVLDLIRAGWSNIRLWKKG